MSPVFTYVVSPARGSQSLCGISLGYLLPIFSKSLRNLRSGTINDPAPTFNSVPLNVRECLLGN